MKSLVKILILAALFIGPQNSNAGMKEFVTILSPGAEVHSVQLDSANPTGSGYILLLEETNTLSWNIQYQGLTGGATAAHFHEGAKGVAGPSVINLMTPSNGFHLPTTTGKSGIFVGYEVLTDEQERDLLAGLWYVNIHTALNPSGEIRGQVGAGTVAPVPLPSAAILLVSGVVGILGLRKKETV